MVGGIVCGVMVRGVMVIISFFQKTYIIKLCGTSFEQKVKK